jgi:hypothetical protein
MKKERFITKLVGGFFLWFNVMVNFEVGFLFDVGAFGEFLLALPQKEPKGLGNLIAPHKLPGQRTTVLTNRCLINYHYNLSLVVQPLQLVV